ncbi:MAG: protoporphyrinogen oxidase [bacterium]
MNQDSERRDLIVVGAGPSGLAYALGAQIAAERAGRPLKLTLLEAEDRAGGWVHTRQVDEYRFETGPYGYLDKHPELGRIVELLGLGDRVLHPAPAAKNRYVFVRGRLRRMPRGPLSFLFSRILSVRAKLRLLREPWAPPHPGGDETVADFASRRLGKEAAEALVVPMFTGIYAGDPDRASLASCFPRMAELERYHGGLFRALWRLRKQVRKSGQGVGAPRGLLTSFEGGLVTLVRSLAARFGEELRLSTAVAKVERTPDGYRVVTSAGDALVAPRVVLAAPARKLAGIVEPLGGELGQLLGGIDYTGVVVVHTAYRPESVRRVPAGFGFLVPRIAGRKLLGSVFVSCIYPDQAPARELLLRNVLGGALQPELLVREDRELVDLVRREHRALLRVADEPAFTEVVRYPGSLPLYEVGHGDRLSRLERALEKHPGLHVTGNALRGIGLADCLAKNFARGEQDYA